MIIPVDKASDYKCCVELGWNCQGSKCMAWKWAQIKDPDKPARVPGPPQGYMDSKIHGYCGRAGG